MKEIWKDIKGFEGRYQVSNTGFVKRLSFLQKHSSNPNKLFKRSESYVKLRIGTAYNGYTNLILSDKNSNRICLFLHRVIAEAFIPNPNNKPFINHKNGIKTDNRIENLEWCTRSENAKHAFKTGLQKPKKGEDHPMSKLSLEDINSIRSYYKSGLSSYRIHKELYPFMSYTTIKDVISKRTWA